MLEKKKKKNNKTLYYPADKEEIGLIDQQEDPLKRENITHVFIPENGFQGL